jgi:hypothetical protein
MSRSSIAMYASPQCTVPGLVRGLIGRSSTRKSASFSTWGMEACSRRLTPIGGNLFYTRNDSKEKEAILTRVRSDSSNSSRNRRSKEVRPRRKEMKKYAKRQMKTNQRILFASQFNLSHSLLRLGEAFVAKQSTSRDAPARGSQCAVSG